ncbi:diguanylate cyclase, partial [Lichenihabitans sp. Uapishka_5]|uniref:GGDEF domain-containing protein n=1 Tax=Lichenihabitans sp. Uapishka_5 TaxID=3037302 RepID=UPI0029E80A2F
RGVGIGREMGVVVGSDLTATGAVAFLGVLAPPPFNDRYTMAAGMIPLLGVILMPVTFREAALLTCVAIPLYVMTALGGWAGHPEQVADLVVFMSGLVILGLKVRYRLALVEKANVQLHLREHDRAEELAKLAHRLEVLSVTDPLTGIANRRGFDLAAEQACRQCLEAGTWLGLLMIDVDYFKSFNDAAGHMAGDQCLRALVAVLTSSCPLEQGHLARFGGEEFVVLLPNLSPDQLKVQAERLRCAVAAAAIPHPGRGGASVTVSVGAAASKPIPLCTNIDELIAAADAALYAAKSRGRNCTMLGQVMSPDVGHRRTDVVTAAA